MPQNCCRNKDNMCVCSQGGRGVLNNHQHIQDFDRQQCLCECVTPVQRAKTRLHLTNCGIPTTQHTSIKLNASTEQAQSD